MQALF